MNWVVASVVMFTASVVMYLLVRKSTLMGTSAQINNLAMFSIPFAVYTLIAGASGSSFALTADLYLEIFVTALCFCYIGNVFSLKAIAYAPNPGYSLVLSKSYVVFTTLVAVVFFQSHLAPSKALAILAIVIFSGLIMVDRRSKKKINALWLPLSIGAFFCWGMLSLASKSILSQQINIFVYLAYLYFFVTMFIFLDIYRNRMSGINSIKLWKVLLPIGFVSSIFNVCMFYAVSVAPNLGYVNAINVSSISVVTLFASWLFKDELNLRKLIGVAGVIAGSVFLLV